MNRYGKRILQLVLRESTHWSFGRYTSSTIQNIIFDALPEKVIYQYRVPPALCHEFEVPIKSTTTTTTTTTALKPPLTTTSSTATTTQTKTEKRLFFSTSGILAMMDELSTYAICLEDRKYRGGVSVDLFTEILKPVDVSSLTNQEVLLVTRTDKIGKILAFCTMELTTVEGELLARGKHIKYLPLQPPVGWILETIAQSSLLGGFLWIYEKTKAKSFSTPLDHIFKIISNKPPLEIGKDILTPEFVFKLLDIKRNDILEDRKEFLEDAPDNHHCDDCEIYTLKVQKAVKNFVGAMHGGALATAIEESSRLFKESRHPELEHHLRLKNIDIRYLSPMTGELVIKVGDDKFSEIISYNEKIKTPSKSVGYIYSQKKRHLCAEFHCEWFFESNKNPQ